MQKIHHKTLKVIYHSGASYDDPLQSSKSASLHQLQVRYLLTEIYKSTGSLNPEFMWWHFKYREVPYNLRCGAGLFIEPAGSTVYGTNSVHFRGPLIWNKLPNSVETSRSTSKFRNIIKKSELLTVGVWYIDSSTLWANFQIILPSLSVLSDHGDTTHLTLYFS